MKTKLNYSMVFFVLITLIHLKLEAQTYSGGSGTIADPYLIANKTDLKYLSEHTEEWTRHFRQTADIVFVAADFQVGGDFYNSGSGFSPIGGASSFTGSYNGDDHTIANLFINRPAQDRIGLFGSISGISAIIKNLGLPGVVITGRNNTGGITGLNTSGNVTNCRVSGTISGATYTGGLIGYNSNNAQITGCHTEITVTATGAYCGGLVGINYNAGYIYNSYSSGTVTGVNAVGGLVGGNRTNNSAVIRSFSTASASGTTEVGGLAGMVFNGGIVQNSYAMGNIYRSSGTLTVNFGGLIGFCESGTIQYNYSKGSVSGNSGWYPVDKGFVGSSVASIFNYNYWDTETSGQSSSASQAANQVEGRTTVQMHQQSNYVTWDFVNTWRIDASIQGGYPYLAWQCNNPSDGGAIGSAQVISINTVPEQLTELTAPEGDFFGILQYQWQSSANGLDFINVENATGIHYSPPALTADIWYKRLVKVTCEPAWLESNTVMITVYETPSFTACPGDINVNTSAGICNRIVDYTVTASGLPAPSLSYVFSGSTEGGGTGTGSGSIFEKGETTVTITAANGFLPNAVCSFQVNVADAEDPVISCPGDQTFTADCLTDTYTVSGTGLDLVSATDNCGVITSVVNSFNGSSTLDGAVFQAGTTVITWTVADDATPPNLSQCSFNVTVNEADKYSISGILQYYKAYAPEIPLNGITLGLQDEMGNPVGNPVITTSGGLYSFDNVCPGNYFIAVLNNPGNAGGINSTDAAQTNWWSVYPYSIEQVRFQAGDGSYDWQIISADALAMQNYFVHGVQFPRSLNHEPPTPWTYFTAGELVHSNSSPYPAPENFPQDMSVSVSNTNITGYNIYALVIGDFNTSFNPSTGTKGTASESLLLTYGDTRQADAGAEIEIPIRLVQASELTAASLILHYPEELFEVTGVNLKLENGNLDWAAKGGELRIGWNSLTPLQLEAGSLWLSIKGKTSASFAQGDEIRFTLAPDLLNELADENFNVIPDAVIGIDVLAFSTTGPPSNDQSTTYNEQCTMNAHPNPFSGYSILDYRLGKEGHVTLEISDMLGRKAALLVDERQSAGEYSVKLDATPLQPGVYMATLKCGELVKSIKLVRNSQ